MKKLIFAVIMALLMFFIFNFIYCNLDGSTFGYMLSFKFKIPYLFARQTSPIPLGFILLITFALGMVFIAVLEALPSLYKTLEIRAKNKKIRDLERELTVARQLAGIENRKVEEPLADSKKDEEEN